MKRLLSLLLVLCLALGCCSAALAASITITQQPESKTVKAGGNTSFTVKAKNVGDAGITWYFINPETGAVTTGRKLSETVPGVKVSNPNSKTIKLSKVPKEMHGWGVYCHLGPKSGGVDTDTVLLLIAGMEEPKTIPTRSDASSSKSSSSKSSSASAPSPGGDAQSPAVTAAPVSNEVVIKGSKVELYKLDQSGKITGEAQKQLVFENGTANFYVKIPEGTNGTIQYLAIGSLRLTPEGEITGMSIRGWKSNATVKITIYDPEAEAEKAAKKAAEEEEPVDESSLVTVTCTNCRFTGWHNSFAESGKVPVGSTITVIASTGKLQKGYSINGEAASHKNEASFTMVVEGDTTIVMEKQKYIE